MMKKIISILMAVIMALSIAPVAFAADGAVYDEETGIYTEKGFKYEMDEENGYLWIVDYAGTGDTIYIPKTLGGFELCDIDAELFSATNASAFSVDADNENFSVKDGVLFSKDGKSLIAYPNGKAGNSYDIPEGVETLESYCFYYSSLKEVTFPSTLCNVCAYVFGKSFNDFLKETEGLIYSGNTLLGFSEEHIGSIITIKDGTETISDYAFPYNSDACIIIPDSVTEIGEQDFYGYICGSEGSAAQKFAEENGIEFIVLGEGHKHIYFPDVAVEITCLNDGRVDYICPCGYVGGSLELKREDALRGGHSFILLGEPRCRYCGISLDEYIYGKNHGSHPKGDCDCKCHSIKNSFFPKFDNIFDFIADLFFRLKLVFWHLTGTHQYCECGCRHY